MRPRAAGLASPAEADSGESLARVREIHRRLQRRYRAADLGNLPDPLDESIASF